MKTSIDLACQLTERFGACQSWGMSALPAVRPTTREALREVLAFARAESLRVLPLGRGTKIGRRVAPAKLDFLIGMGGFNRVIAFEPGDGTLTAEGGASLDELAALCRSAQRTIVPELLPGASLGGAIATAETGSDRLWRGPMREHVLGLEVMLSSGATSRSGGRLVKNVAGYDLHRLHTGAWGGLGLIMEATLRLFPLPAVERRLSMVTADLDAVHAAAFALREARIPAKRIWSHKPTRLFIDLAGREDVVQSAHAQASDLLGELEVIANTPGLEQRPAVVLHALPSKSHELGTAATALHAALSEGATLSFDPLLARAAIALDAANDRPASELAQLVQQASIPSGVHVSLPTNKEPALPAEAATLASGLERALDSTGTFAR